MPQAKTHDTPTSDVADELGSFVLHLKTENKSESTVVTYSKAIVQLDAYLAEAGMPRLVEHIHREHIESFLVGLQERGMKPATVSQRFRSLQQFFKWLAAEDVIDESPMRNMKPPTVPVVPPPVLSEDEVDRLLDTVKGSDFESRRDRAILMLFMDSGLRRGEMAGLKVGDIDRDLDVANVVGKGRKPRSAPFGVMTAQALDRYIKRARAKHRDAKRLPWLWLGKRGHLTENGIEQMVKRRGAQANIVGLHPHRFRHTFAHQWLADGGRENDLMRIAGWTSRQMVARYGASAADERARNAYRDHSPMDKRR